MNEETKRCLRCGVDRPLSFYRKGSWGVCAECLPKKPKKKMGRPPKKKVIQVIEVAPTIPIEPEPQPEAQAQPEKTKKGRLKKSVRQLNTEKLRKLLNQNMPMELRAEIMIELAKKTNEPVTALRAISEINQLTGIRVDDQGKTAVPLFALPRGVDVKTTADPVEVRRAGA